jgi:hypothetical protein
MPSQCTRPESLRRLTNMRGQMQICMQKVLKNVLYLGYGIRWSRDRRLDGIKWILSGNQAQFPVELRIESNLIVFIESQAGSFKFDMPGQPHRSDGASTSSNSSWALLPLRASLVGRSPGLPLPFPIPYFSRRTKTFRYSAQFAASLATV